MNWLTYKKVLVCLVFTASQISGFTTQAQLIEDEGTLKIVESCIDHIYNMNSRAAQVDMNRVKAAYPNHPVNPLMEAMQIYWGNFPLYKNPAQVTRYHQKLEECTALANKNLDNKKDITENTFYVMCANAYMGGIDASMGNYMKAMNYTKKAYDGVKEGFDHIGSNPEFLFTTGLYNYYVERYALDYPKLSSTIHFLLPKGNLKLGLAQMERSTNKSRFTKTEANFYLFKTYIQFEDNPAKALEFSSKLTKEYANNPYFLASHIEALILSGRYAEAEKYNQKLAKYKAAFFPYAYNVFEGLVQEHLYKADSRAEVIYKKAQTLPKDGIFAKEIEAYLLNGLARIEAKKGMQKNAVKYYKDSLKVADYKRNKNEAERYIAANR